MWILSFAFKQKKVYTGTLTTVNTAVIMQAVTAFFQAGIKERLSSQTEYARDSFSEVTTTSSGIRMDHIPIFREIRSLDIQIPTEMLLESGRKKRI